MKRISPSIIIGVAALLLVPVAVRFAFPAAEKYYLHLLIQILIWSFIYTGWSLMGRFGLTSLGHGAFTGIGAYVMVLLWNYAGVTPWIGIPIAIVVSVIDTGGGMPADVRDQLFTKRAISTKPGGTGLGMKIVRDVVEAHGGTVWVESELGAGTKVHIRLPHTPGESARS